MITIYGIKNCDSVKKAIQYMKKHQLSYDFVDFRENPISSAKIHAWLEKVDLKTLFNKRSTTYRTLKLKALNLDCVEEEAWLAKENMLLKRPVIEYDDKVIVGFDEAQYDSIFLE